MIDKGHTTYYLGDGALVDFLPHGSFRIYTERGDGTHEVFLEPDALKVLFEFAKEKGVKL